MGMGALAGASTNPARRPEGENVILQRTTRVRGKTVILADAPCLAGLGQTGVCLSRTPEGVYLTTYEAGGRAYYEIALSLVEAERLGRALLGDTDGSA